MSAASRAVAHLSWDILQQLVKTGAWTATWSESGLIGNLLTYS